MQKIHTSFQSESVRINFISHVRDGSIPVFKKLVPVTGSAFLELDISPPWAPSVVNVEEIYHRKETHTSVFKIHFQGGHRLIFKLYRLPTGTPTTQSQNNGSLNHEIEVSYLKLFTELLVHGVCPNFTLPVGHAIFADPVVKQLLPEHTWKKGNYMALLGECGDTTLNRLVRETQLSSYALVGILLQVILSLRVVHEILPSFRHNDLHLSNVLIQVLNAPELVNTLESEDLCVKYQVNDEKFYIDIVDCPYRALVWDMYFGSISEEDAKKYQVPEVVPRKKQLFAVKDKTDPNRCSQTHYFDLHKLFDSLEFVLNKKTTKTSASVALRHLINQVVPNHLKCMTRGLTHQDKTRMRLWEAKHITPNEILQHQIFDQFRVPSPSRTVIREYRYPRGTKKKITLRLK